jgi:hemoglobin-like flavoprotein
MTPARMQLVRDSWALVLPMQQEAASLFYERLFVLAPEVRPLFRRDPAEQGAKLMAALHALVLSLGRMEQMLPMARELAIRHVAWGVQPAHYEQVGQALLWTLREGLGDAATPEVMAGWAEAYGELSGAMKAAAYPTPGRAVPQQDATAQAGGHGVEAPLAGPAGRAP